MPGENIVVIGASAGGVEALKTLAAKLPNDLPAAIFVVLHVGNYPSTLPEILSSVSRLPAVHPTHGQHIESGMIYIAPSDHHMLLSQPGRIDLVHGPKENRTRPAINPLFRSAAATYGNRVTGVILTGMLDDGVAGLAEIKARGGMAVVQDPKTAVYPSMPASAIQSVPVDYILPVEEIPGILSRLSNNSSAPQTETTMEERNSDLTCPECRGPLREFRIANVQEYRCRVGHAYSMLALERDQHDTVERKLWEAVIALEEAAEIADQLSLRFEGNYKKQANHRREQASILKDILHDVKT